ncbi:hypothetical protein CEE45_14975 [Candidatus Heimdallarchaeota archaeon B3_Heim]|nr:MAG: hypothetical protein CEE45_14975 [Candidatus Heimdallarchaeota archaeon B3_Heim]
MVSNELIDFEYWKGDLKTMLHYRTKNLDNEVNSAAVIDNFDPDLDPEPEPITISDYYTVDLQNLRIFIRKRFNFDVIFLPDIDHHVLNRKLCPVRHLMPLSSIMHLISPPWKWSAHHAIMLVDEFGRYMDVFRVDNYFYHEKCYILCFYKGRDDIIGFFEKFYNYDEFINRNREKIRIYLQTHHKECLIDSEVPDLLLDNILNDIRVRMEGSEVGFGIHVIDAIKDWLQNGDDWISEME